MSFQKYRRGKYNIKTELRDTSYHEYSFRNIVEESIILKRSFEIQVISEYSVRNIVEESIILKRSFEIQVISEYSVRNIV
jgi:hypothetical protein